MKFLLAKKVNMTQIFGEDGKVHQPIMIHRALMGSIERFFGILIEHFGGAFPLWLTPVQVKILTVSEKQAAAAKSASPAPTAAAQELGVESAQEVAQPVKVNLDLLDKLMNLVSEMVLARNRLLPFAADFGDHHFSGAVRTIDLLTQELQERMMMTRMQPISQIWSKFPRLIRDVSNECGKQVNLVQDGEDTELDRTLLDAIRDPLVHIIRNCIDHGIETPEQRAHLGKPATGQVLLKASHENGMVVIQIADDGGGIDFDLVCQKAIEKKLLTAEHALTLTDIQLLEYIFLPGFSTKSVVTNLSGRGVGMDVVKTNIAKIGGSTNERRGEFPLVNVVDVVGWT